MSLAYWIQECKGKGKLLHSKIISEKARKLYQSFSTGEETGSSGNVVRVEDLFGNDFAGFKEEGP